MGRLKSDQGQLFYEFHLGDAVPEDHLARKIDAALDLSWLRSELAPHYSSMGRPSIDPELMIRMLVVGYVFAIRSERLICREVQVNLAYRWFCKLGIEDAIPDHSAFSRARNERFRDGDIFRRVFEPGRRDMHRVWFGWWRRLCSRCEPDCGRRQQAALDRWSGLAQGSRSGKV
jgi:transposase